MQEKSCLHMSALGLVHNPSARHDHRYRSCSGGLSPSRFEESRVERPDKHSSDGEGTRESSELVLDVDRGRS